MIDFNVMAECAPNVSPVTLEKIIQVESGGNRLAMNVNFKRVFTNINGVKEEKKVLFKSPIKIKNIQDAVSVAYLAIDSGHTVDLGYMQVNSSNLKSLGYTVEDMFNPCKNIKAGAAILSAFYEKASSKYPSEQLALRAALSAYNTGDFNKGWLNGYLQRYGVSKSVPIIPKLNPYTSDTTIISSIKNKDVKMSDVKHVNPIVSKSVDDSMTPGVQIEYTPDEADENGAFMESALSEADAWDSNVDVADDTAIVVGGVVVSKHKDEK